MGGNTDMPPELDESDPLLSVSKCDELMHQLEQLAPSFRFDRQTVANRLSQTIVSPEEKEQQLQLNVRVQMQGYRRKHSVRQIDLKWQALQRHRHQLNIQSRSIVNEPKRARVLVYKDDKCAICLERLASQAVTDTACKHQFHTACVAKWWGDSNFQCAICSQCVRCARSMATCTCDQSQDDELSDESSTTSVTSRMRHLRGGTSQIWVRLLNGKKLGVDMDLNGSVLYLATTVAKHIGSTTNDIRLIYGGSQLDHSESLSKYQIAAQATIDLVLRLRGGGGDTESKKVKKIKKIKKIKKFNKHRTFILKIKM